MEMWWIFLIAGLAAGGFFLMLFRSRGVHQRMNALEQALADSEARLNEEKGRASEIRDFYEKQFISLKQELHLKEEAGARLQQEITQLREERSRLTTLNEQLDQKLSTEKQRLQEQQEQLRNEFKVLANEMLKKSSGELSETNRNQLGVLIDPLREQLNRFEKKVQEVHIEGEKKHAQLSLELSKLRELNTQLQEEAGNLTKALKGDSKKQGNWGEFVLEKILEISGLEKGREYVLQETIQVDGSTFRPDVIVHLPEEKHLIIDSKVSLTQYELYASADLEEERALALRQHILSVKNHIRQLSDKEYFNGKGLDTPDFVLMFMPVEPAFSVALREDPGLFDLAWEKKIVMVSPTTLLATLRTVASIWRQEKQTQNALEISRAGGALYDKFMGFLNDLEDIGKRISQLQGSYEAASSKLSKGKGNLVRAVEKLRKLGVKSEKQIPATFLPREDMDDEEDIEKS